MGQFAFVLLIAAVLSLSVNGQVIFPRQCPNHPIMTPFMPQQYSGRWYEIKRYDTDTQTGGDCTVSLYTLASPFVFDVTYHMLVGPQPIQINGQSVVSFPDESPLRGMLSLSFGGPPTNSNYWILSTDFVNYSVVWFCQNINATASSGKDENKNYCKNRNAIEITVNGIFCKGHKFLFCVLY